MSWRGGINKRKEVKNMPEKSLKNIIGNILIATSNWLRPSKKQLESQSLQKELEEFMKNGDVDVGNPEKLRKDFKKYLKDKGYAFDEENMHVQYVDNSAQEQISNFKLPKRIYKISEDLNKYTKGLDIFMDTTEMIPGLICYTIEEIAPTERNPFVRYKPVPRVITQIHDSGVNGGTIFFSYSYKFLSSTVLGNKKSGKFVSESEVIYSPLTEQQAKYICKLLNVQSRLFYEKQKRKLNRAVVLQQRTK